MNWIEALATIDCLMMSVDKTLEETNKSTLKKGLEEVPLLETPEEMLEAFQEEELEEKETQEIPKEEELLHLCYLAEEVEKDKPSKEEVKLKHNVTLRTPKKVRRAKSRGVITEQLTEDELKAKIQEDVEGDPIPLRDVPQYFKDYKVDEVVIVMPQAIRPDQAEVQPREDGVYDGPARTKEIDLALEGEKSKHVFIGEHLTEEESDKLKALLMEYRDCFAWSYEDLKGIDEQIVVHTIPLRVDAVPVTQRPYRTNPKIAQAIQDELKKLLDVGFIYEIEHSDWVSPIVCVPKKNGTL
jgi:hypothetical protein